MVKLLKYFFVLFFINNTLNAQINLVPNPSFELYDTCPDNIGQFNFITDWNMILNSPDYYNGCANFVTAPNCSVPYNFVGYQNPNYGNAYAGNIAYVDGFPPYRELLGAQLLAPLVIGQKYYIRFYASLTLGYNSNSGANKIGLRFTNVQHSLSNPPLINNFAHIYTDSIITDSLNWTLISGSFIADSNYNYLEVGNFFDNTNTIIQIIRPQMGNWSYFYLDDISVSTDSLLVINSHENKNTINDFSLFPNPSTGLINLKLSSIEENTILHVYDFQGNLIENKKITEVNTEFNIKSNGFYYFNIITEKINKKKIILIQKNDD